MTERQKLYRLHDIVVAAPDKEVARRMVIEAIEEHIGRKAVTTIYNRTPVVCLGIALQPFKDCFIVGRENIYRRFEAAKPNYGDVPIA